VQIIGFMDLWECLFLMYYLFNYVMIVSLNDKKKLNGKFRNLGCSGRPIGGTMGGNLVWFEREKLVSTRPKLNTILVELLVSIKLFVMMDM
jgi:hypothetical protein